VGAISRLSGGWYFSKLFGLPLLTRSQREAGRKGGEHSHKGQ
jgi:hypothetical protein